MTLDISYSEVSICYLLLFTVTVIYYIFKLNNLKQSLGSNKKTTAYK